MSKRTAFYLYLAGFLFTAAQADADMIIRLKDGRTLNLPFAEDDVDSITFGPSGKPQGVKSAAPPAARAAKQAREAGRLAGEKAESARQAAERAEAAAAKAAAALRDAAAILDAARKLARELKKPARKAAASPAAKPKPERKPVRKPGTLRVGPGEAYPVPSAAAKAARDGDVVDIRAGTYSGDVAVWRANNLVIRGVGGTAHLKAAGRSAQGKAIWVIGRNNTIVENMEFSGSRVADLNGAGIRLEGAGLTVRRSSFHDNQMGLLTGSNPNSDIVIENSEFYRNTVDYQRTKRLGHNIYIGSVRSFTLRASYVHHPFIGHNVKSRARRNLILYNRLMDEADGTSSYLIDLPDGGATFLIGNLLHQGKGTDNGSMVSYGTKGGNPKQGLYVANNTFVNDKGGGNFIRRVGSGKTLVLNNIFVGPGTILSGPGVVRSNLIVGQGGIGNVLKDLLGGSMWTADPARGPPSRSIYPR